MSVVTTGGPWGEIITVLRLESALGARLWPKPDGEWVRDLPTPPPPGVDHRLIDELSKP